MKSYIIYLMVFVGAINYAQTTYKGTITDKNNKPILGATIVAHNTDLNGVVSNLNGFFEITLENTNKVIISHISFLSKEVTLIEGNNIIIMDPTDFSLNGVVVSASRELQKRNEVPASISVITSKNIKETKAFTLDQLTNQVPGVYVATSKATSNEQHFTAVCSPITTRALFLFIEDGIPLKPIAVFNHNPLLELNNLSFERVEILKGPASSIYGSEAIGGSFNL